MAAGDVVSAITSVATGAAVNYQPAAGVEVAVVSLMGDTAGTTPNSYQDVTGAIYDGTNTSVFWSRNTNMVQKVFITNTLYLRVTNQAAGTTYVGYTGMQVK